MAQEYYSLEEAAEALGIAPSELNRRREANEIRAYRGSTGWRFKVEDIQALQTDQSGGDKASSKPSSGESDDVLLTDLEFEGTGESSGTVIGPTEGAAAAESDIQLTGESDIRLTGESDLQLNEPSGEAAKEEPAASTGSSDLDLTLDGDFSFEDSQLTLQSKEGQPPSDSTVDVAGEQGMEDDDLVLGGSGSSGSDITIGGDSGISLVDPTDSGLSLEEPVEFESPDQESLELGEDDMLTFSEEADSESPTQLKADDDFLLTPLEDSGDEDSESGSQVIALDAEPEGEEVPGGSGPSMAAMLDEDTSGDQGIGLEAAPTATMSRPSYTEAAPAGPAAAALPEAPYAPGIVVAMGFCVAFLAFAGMMSFDLLRNMWSWQQPYDFNSALMDMVLSMF